MKERMIAMRLEETGADLVETLLPIPTPASNEILVKIIACGVCRTDLHVQSGELPGGKLPVTPGHEAIGKVASVGDSVLTHQIGDEVGIPWLGHTCHECKYCLEGNENLCEAASFHGFNKDGGFAEYCLVEEGYAISLPKQFFNAASTPLLCAGLIGYRSYQKTNPEKVRKLGLYGFGASAHILAQVAISDGKDVYAFTRSGDTKAQNFALKLGCTWAGSSTEKPPDQLDAAIVFAPVGSLMLEALKATDKGGRVISAGIHMSPIPQIDYQYLWEERSLHSVANLKRKDGEDFFNQARKSAIKTTVKLYPLTNATQALNDLREGRIIGAAVLVI